MTSKEDILTAYHQMVINTRQALRIAGLSEKEIVLKTINLPEYDKLIPEDAVKLYHDIKKLTIYYLKDLGFTVREIAKRIGGSSYPIIWQLIKDREGVEEHDGEINQSGDKPTV